MRNATLVVLATLFGLGVCELSLRYLPIMNLRFAPYYLDRFSYRYNHKPTAHDDFRIVHPSQTPACGPHPSDTLRILLLGDSWMEGDGIPLGIADYMDTVPVPRRCPVLINGGATSFSPSLYTLAGEELGARYRPDLIVVNIDETDLMDEALRYKATTLRGADGRLERVVPGMVDELWVYGHRVLDKQPVYLLRLAEFVYLREVQLPRLREAVLGYPNRPSYDELMAPQLADSPRVQYRTEVEYFDRTVSEMLDRLSVVAGGHDRLLVTHHPHFLGVPQRDSLAPRYNRIVAEILIDQTRKKGVRYYDAASDLCEMYGREWPTYFQWPKDPFSHLTDAGFRRYGNFIGRALLASPPAPRAQSTCD